MTDYSDTRENIHGGAVYEAARRLRIPPEKILDFSANINPLGPPSGVITGTAGDRSITSYPDLTDFVTALSDKLQISPEKIVVSNGSTALIFAAVRALKPRRALLIEPAFAEYRRALQSVDAEAYEMVLQETDAFQPDFSSINKSLRLRRYDLVVLNNPHNPTGAVYSREAIEGVVQQAAEVGAFMILDEAFIDYAPGASMVTEVAAQSNLVVLRSLTKFYGMPGLRVGYAVCCEGLAARLRDQIEAWPVSSFALAAAGAAIAESAYEREAIRRNEVLRCEFQSSLEHIGFTVFPSAANFLLVKLAKSGSGLAMWLEQYGVLIRRCDSFRGLGDNFVRIAVRTEADNRRLVELIRRWLEDHAKTQRGEVMEEGS